MNGMVIIGAGEAGTRAAFALREARFCGPVTLIGAEAHLPYERPPLSKGYLLGNDPIEKAFVHEPSWYTDHGVDVRTGTEVTAIDLDGQVVRTADGDQRYDALLLATGAQPRRLALADDAWAWLAETPAKASTASQLPNFRFAAHVRSCPLGPMSAPMLRRPGPIATSTFDLLVMESPGTAKHCL